MISKLRGFSNSKLAGVLVGIIIIPFVFWGMGSVFSGGNTNNVAKINNEAISSKDFVNFINESRLTNDIIKASIDKNHFCQLVVFCLGFFLSKFLQVLHLNFRLIRNYFFR